MSRISEIRSRLETAFDPSRLEVEDESEKHRGHAGYQDGGESHFRVLMRAEAMAGLGRLARHRAVHAALGADLIGAIHALSLDLDA
ncbi:BolA family protein [Pseudooceanicola sp.]|uniref:BolA family protein n=1 Tax=Pseudooceanicola sp. TaxID=1914328 RepID=UPI002632450E|nr:BolA family protein [Pseudooceanicola sp.]MDF1854356.1 BolA family transcriptional regulator [Pseudooceanicola sp.]